MLGRGLIALAILSLVGELTARAFHGAGGYLSAEELWAILAPEGYAAMRAWVRQEIFPVWTYGIGPVLKLPAWLLFGAPGIAALWLGERADAAGESTDAAFLYDELEKQAKEEGFAADAADTASLYDELEKQAKEEGFAVNVEQSPAAGADEIVASAREAEADLARDPLPSPPADPSADDENSAAVPPSRPPS